MAAGSCYPSAMMFRSCLLWAAAAALSVGCGGGGGGDDDVDAAAIDSRPSCVETGCTPDLACNPANGICEPIPCNTHDDCAPMNYCSPAGVCAPSNTGGPCSDDDDCTNGETCIGNFCACAGQQFEAEGVPPNVLIVLDRSGSMDIDAGGGMTRWQVAVSAINGLLASHGNQVRFGLDLFAPPGDGSCGAGQVLVDVGPATASQITSTLSANSPDSLTPIGDTLAALTNYQGLRDPTRENYVLLITDGAETCGGNGVAATNSLRALMPEVKVFAVGFGSGVDVDLLNNIANAGGTARPGGPPFYYQADDAASLQMAFDAIGAAVLSCTYTLAGSPDEASMFVRFDGADVMRDPTHQNGWDYDGATNTLTFYGAACNSLRGGDVTDLVVGSGCAIGRWAPR
jgi:hypothetical protein